MAGGAPASAAEEPLGLWCRADRAPKARAQLVARQFELSSRGDRVSGRLLLPPDPGEPCPLALLLHGAEGSARSRYLEALGAPLARGGAAVASIDLPLHGARADHKLRRILLRAARGPADAAALALAEEFARQVRVDLRRTLDALAGLAQLDASRCALAGFSLGAAVAAAFCAADPRPRAAVLALAGAGLGPPQLDPARQLARIAPRPLLLVQAERDRVVPRAAADALAAAARGPVEQRWFDADHDRLPAAAFRTMAAFLTEQLARAQGRSRTAAGGAGPAACPR